MSQQLTPTLLVVLILLAAANVGLLTFQIFDQHRLANQQQQITARLEVLADMYRRPGFAQAPANRTPTEHYRNPPQAQQPTPQTPTPADPTRSARQNRQPKPQPQIQPQPQPPATASVKPETAKPEQRKPATTPAAKTVDPSSPKIKYWRTYEPTIQQIITDLLAGREAKVAKQFAPDYQSDFTTSDLIRIMSPYKGQLDKLLSFDIEPRDSFLAFDVLIQRTEGSPIVFTLIFTDNRQLTGLWINTPSVKQTSRMIPVPLTRAPTPDELEAQPPKPEHQPPAGNAQRPGSSSSLSPASGQTEYDRATYTRSGTTCSPT